MMRRLLCTVISSPYRINLLHVAIPTFVIWITYLRWVDAHIVLTYPPARKYALDFLDNSHSLEPCGMPRGLSDPTYLEVGSEINITWRSAYPHQGGYSLELLDANYDRVSVLVPALSGREPRAQQFQTSSILETSRSVIFPKNLHCENCTIRLTKQALEWNNLTSDSEGFILHSCADVNIVDQVDTSQKCSGHGSWAGTECVCDGLYTGNVCQYIENCNTDTDCSSHGKCIEVGGSSYPKKRCFCAAGWLGNTCDRASPLRVRLFNKMYYSHQNLAEGFDLYWLIDQNLAEIEIIVQSKSLSWIAIGWRPSDVPGDCRKDFPLLPHDEYTPHGAALLSPSNLTENNWSLQSRSLVKEQFPFSYAILPRTSNSDAIRPRRDVVTMPENATGWVFDVNGTNGGNVNLGETVTLPNKIIDDIHPMDCTDIIIGSARNTFGQVQDSYTRDRSTPQADSFYGGDDNLIAAVAYEEDGVTTMRFKRALAAVEPSDHSFTNQPMHVIFARGQDSGTFSHSQPTASETANLSMGSFYQPDELKYHGSHALNRGTTTINFFDEHNQLSSLTPSCVGEWKTPANCAGTGCRYIARWEYLEDIDSVYFRIQSRSRDRWTGIGFSAKLDHMPDSDLIVGWVDDEGKVQITDRYATGYRAPKVDKKQYLKNLAGYANESFVTLEFTRPRTTNDTENRDLSDGQCWYFMFPVDGGKFDKISGVISKHQYIPTVSPKKICVHKCGSEVHNNVASPASLMKKSSAAVSVMGRNSVNNPHVASFTAKLRANSPSNDTQQDSSSPRTAQSRAKPSTRSLTSAPKSQHTIKRETASSLPLSTTSHPIPIENHSESASESAQLATKFMLAQRDLDINENDTSSSSEVASEQLRGDDSHVVLVEENVTAISVPATINGTISLNLSTTRTTTVTSLLATSALTATKDTPINTSPLTIHVSTTAIPALTTAEPFPTTEAQETTISVLTTWSKTIASMLSTANTFNKSSVLLSTASVFPTHPRDVSGNNTLGISSAVTRLPALEKISLSSIKTKMQVSLSPIGAGTVSLIQTTVPGATSFDRPPLATLVGNTTVSATLNPLFTTLEMQQIPSANNAHAESPSFELPPFAFPAGRQTVFTVPPWTNATPPGTAYSAPPAIFPVRRIVPQASSFGTPPFTVASGNVSAMTSTQRPSALTTQHLESKSGISNATQKISPKDSVSPGVFSTVLRNENSTSLPLLSPQSSVTFAQLLQSNSTAPMLASGLNLTTTEKPTTVLQSITGNALNEVPPGGGSHTECRGEWRSPMNCVNEKCEYLAMWEYNAVSDEIQFFIQSSHTDRWTGIGFSPSGRMPQSSVIYGYKQPDGRVIVVEGRAEGYYPTINESDPETTNNVGWFKDGLLGISFRRNRTVEAELWGNATNCPYFLFPYNGGAVDPLSGIPAKHVQTPVVSATRICIKPCSFLPTIPVVATTASSSTSTLSTTTMSSATTLMPVIEGTPCRAIFSYPRNCNTSTCIYVAQWDYLPQTDEINFLIQSNRVNKWTGIGFSEEGEMAKSDIVVGWVGGEGRATISDRWATGYSEPQRDLQQDVTRLGGAMRYGTQLITFTRKRQTGDERDFQFSDTYCPYLIFPVFGGTYDDASEVIDKHEESPVISDQRICIRACRQKTTLNPLGPTNSLFAGLIDRKLLMIDPGFMSSITMSSPGMRTRSQNYTSNTKSYSQDRTVNFQGVNLFGGSTGVTRRTAPTRAKSTSKGNVLHSSDSDSSGDALSNKGSQEGVTLSPDDIIKQLLLEAGLKDVAVEVVSRATTPSLESSALGSTTAKHSPSPLAATSPLHAPDSSHTAVFLFTPAPGPTRRTAPMRTATTVSHQSKPDSSVLVPANTVKATGRVSASTTQSPDDVLKSLLQQAGLKDVSVSVISQATTLATAAPIGISVSDTTGTVFALQENSSLTTVPSNNFNSSLTVGSQVTASARLVFDKTTAVLSVSPNTTQGVVPPPGAVLLSITGQSLPSATNAESTSGILPSESSTFVPVSTVGVVNITSTDPVSVVSDIHGSVTPATMFVLQPRVNTNSPRNGMEIKTWDNSTAGLDVVVPPKPIDQVSISPFQNAQIGPSPSTNSPANDSGTVTLSQTKAISPDEMFKMLLKQSLVNIATSQPSPSSASVDETNNPRTSAAYTSILRVPERENGRNGPSALGQPSFSMSPSVPVPSVLPDPDKSTPAKHSDGPSFYSRDTTPLVTERVKEAPPSTRGSSDVFIGDASDVIMSGASSGNTHGSGMLPQSDQGTYADDEICGEVFRFPSGCKKESCSYVAAWRPGSNLDEIEFTLETNTPDFWTGIGFSDDRLMKGSDIIYGFIRSNGSPRLVDAYASDYAPPVRDFRNDVRTIDGGRRNNRTYYHFARKYATNDPNDYEFGKGKCPYFKFPVLGSTFDPNTLTIDKHRRVPVVSPNRICIKPCDPAARARIRTTERLDSSSTVAPPFLIQSGTSLKISSGDSNPSVPQKDPNASTVPTTKARVSAAGKNSTADNKSVLSCSGEFRYPDMCNQDTCDYIAQWEYLAATDEIKFDIATAKADEWTGIGFNDNREMPHSDIIYGWMEDDGKARMTDAYTDVYAAPVRDLRQDAKNIAGKVVDRFTTLTLTRKRLTKDDKDFQFTDNKCPYFIFPVRGGVYDPNSMMIMKHKATPLVSTQRICITSACAATAVVTASPASGQRNSLDGKPPQGNEGKALMGDASDFTTLPSTTVQTEATTVEFSNYMPCEGFWKYPELCVEPNCIYVASWSFLDDADAIRFVVKAKAAGWTGIGFNDDMAMKNADAIIGWVTSKTTVVTDRHCVDNIGAPMDDEQSVYDIAGRKEDGYQIIEFTRKRDTQDPNGQNYVFGDQKCPFFLFPVVGGSYDSYGGIQAHSQKAKPKISAGRICVRSCNIDVPRRMVVSFRIVDRSWSPDLDGRNSAAFHKLDTEVAAALRKVLAGTPGFRGTRVISFRPGSVIADVEIIIDPTANQTSVAGAKTIKSILTTQIQQRHQLGAFSLDPTSLSISGAEQLLVSSKSSVQPESTTAALSNRAPESEMRTYAIIGGVCGIIAILLFLAFGKVWYDRKSRIERRKERARKMTVDVLGSVPENPVRNPRGSRTSSLDARQEAYSLPKPPYEVSQNGNSRNGRAASMVTRSSASLPPDYYNNGDLPRRPRQPKKPRSSVTDDHPLHRLSQDESDRTLTTYSSTDSRKNGKTMSEADVYNEWGAVDDKYYRPPDFYFMPSQRRWTQVPQGF